MNGMVHLIWQQGMVYLIKNEINHDLKHISRFAPSNQTIKFYGLILFDQNKIIVKM